MKEELEYRYRPWSRNLLAKKPAERVKFEAMKSKIVSLYWEQGLSIADTAAALNVPRNKLSYYMARLQIQRRPRGERLKPVTLRRLSDYERGYIAAFLDGEGSITWQGKKPHVSFINTNLEFLRKAQTILGTGVIRFQSRNKRGNWQQCYYLAIWRLNDIQGLLEQIIDDLVVKKERARQALGYIWSKKRLFELPKIKVETQQ